MLPIRIRSSVYDYTVDAENTSQAFYKFLTAENPSQLGKIVKFNVGVSRPVYVLTQNLLEELGLWGD